MALDGFHEGFTRRAMRAEMLDAETEQALAQAWRERRDEAALHRLILAHMRLAISQASKYRRYGVPVGDLIQEASMGLMKAADRFDTDRGVRFSTYAMWWIRASIQDCVMRNWSMVRTGSTSSQKALFFNLRRIQAQLMQEAREMGEEMDQAMLHAAVAEHMGVPVGDVEMMHGRMAGGDLSLNAPQSDAHESREWIDTIPDEDTDTESMVAARRDTEVLRHWLDEALQRLSPRERGIVVARKLSDTPRTLEDLGEELGLSKERVRQIEAAALAKMRRALESHAGEAYALLR
jgi:RNA polymerase sigma-32 factor